jgi:site-specific DNA recombinase
MIRIASYARYSDDKQSAASIADQHVANRRHASTIGGPVIAEYSDPAISGASLDRPGMQALLRSAYARDIDVVVCESLDRLSRDLEDIAAIYKRLSFAGVRIVTVAEGDIGELHVGLKGTMNRLFLTDLAHKTRRGLRGRALAGKSAGGMSFGYRHVRGETGIRIGEREIEPTEAATVRRIFEAYVAGQSPKSIARSLNAEGVRGPRGAAWSPSTIHGHRERGTGILNNPLYRGELVWNRLIYVKDPVTGKRISRLNPESTWVRVDVPELRIVDEPLWQAAKRRQGPVVEKRAFNRFRRPVYLFSGLTKCGVCGGGYIVSWKDTLACYGSKDRGTCTNRLRITRDEVESRIIRGLQQLLDGRRFERFCAVYEEETQRLEADARATRATAARELAGFERQIQTLVRAIKDGVSARSVADELHRLEHDRDALQQRLAAPAPIILRPDMAKTYRDAVAALTAGLTPDGGHTAAVRGLIARVELVPDAAGQQLQIRLRANPGEVLLLATGTDGPVQLASRPRNQQYLESRRPGDDSLSDAEFLTVHAGLLESLVAAGVCDMWV